MHNEYEHTATRRIYKKDWSNTQNQKKLRSILASDTGFDTICSSCLQYKSLDNCKSVGVLSREKVRKFIIDQCFLLKNRHEGQFVCNLCLKDIKNNKMPKRSHKNKFKFANLNFFLWLLFGILFNLISFKQRLQTNCPSCLFFNKKHWSIINFLTFSLLRTPTYNCPNICIGDS